jgi:tRNA G18 (ribose-2'-O)-methylase SpoU
MPIEYVTATGDARLRDYIDLTDVALRTSFESENGLYIAESSKVILRALRAGHQPRSILMSVAWLPRMTELISEVETRYPATPIFIAQEPELEAITGFHVHRGALASMQRPSLPTLQSLFTSETKRIVILDGVVDHTNVGAIFRSVASLGAQVVLITDQCADPFYRRSIRVSMGAVFQVPWTRIDWNRDREILTGAGFTTAAFALTDQSIDLDDFEIIAPERLALVFGAEGTGLSQAVIDSSDVCVRIPMSQGVDSLNVAAAAAVAVWALRTKPKSQPAVKVMA